MPRQGAPCHPAAAAWILALCVTGCGATYPVLYPDPALERNTVVGPSLIPGAGLGAFARTRIRKGDIIGEYGGQLMPPGIRPKDSAYLIELPTCASVGGRRYQWMDGRGSRAHMTRVNFAPRIINGVKTHLQNAHIGGVCHRPFIVFVALRDIAPGEEILVGYGPFYGYDAFMKDKKVQRYFCHRIGIDCSKKFEYCP